MKNLHNILAGDQKWSYITITITSLVFVTIIFLSKGTYDAGDGLRHYIISRYSWNHYELFLDHWGKPFFTFISSPFSQFGLLGINFFNLVNFIITSIFCVKIATLYHQKNLWLIPILLGFSVSYFPTMNSGLTEPFFGCIMSVSFYLLLNKKVLWATILISFLPFIRTEGFIMLLPFALVLLIQRKFLFLPLLWLGFIVISIIGYFHYYDIFWVITKNPYTGHNADLYGHGDFWYFFRNYKNIFGIPIAALTVVGVLSIFYTIKNKLSNLLEPSRKRAFIILIYGSFILYFFAHVIFWWKGIVGSLGLLRVMAAVMPMIALISLVGVNYIIDLFAIFLSHKNLKIVKFIFIASLILLVIKEPFKRFNVPFKLDAEGKVLKKVANWVLANNYNRYRIYYIAPFLSYALNIDPFNPKKGTDLWSLYPAIKEYGIGVVPDSSIVIWDAHFGANECRIPLNKIMNDSNFAHLKGFYPKNKFNVLGGYNYEVHVFQKVKKPITYVETKSVVDNLDEIKIENRKNTTIVANKHSNSGTQSSMLDSNIEYSFTYKFNKGNIPEFTKIRKISFTVSVYSSKSIKGAKLVCSINDNLGKTVFWKSVNIEISNKETNKWQEKHKDFYLTPDIIKENNTIVLYIWNSNKEEFFCDDFSFHFSKIME